ncbi:uncharacterized protein J4E88_005106 [Alternaria novae-zelandiae]|uniref:uncharacterized protein n=1 Tax=Alternaria novae-zelandiae TaxID=430562 RepID=UPI0020C54851|nr:uncharacterized protein J4E88_005106 [Alternaria novae-zelandiae]KAI4682216.1 hypothetical protein J4E88_005106 [Alternaria novae-zelandiae]
MLNLLTSLVWLLACLSLVPAVPVDTLAGNVTSMARRDTANASPYPYSLQLILSKFPVRRYNWFIFQGPQGIAVDPCLDPKDDPNFERVYFGRELAGEEDDIAHPPFPPLSVYADIEYSEDCHYIGSGVDAGQFRCGDYYIIDCAKDPRYNEATFRCPDGREYHRGYNCEF